MVDGIYMVQFFENLVPALSERGRDDLVAIIHRLRPYLMGKQEVANQLVDAISSSIPYDQRFAVAHNQYFQGDIGNQPRGRYWGLPRDGNTAIRELRHLRESGVVYVVFTHETLWWLDHFEGLRDYLENTYNRLQMESQSLLYHFPS